MKGRPPKPLERHRIEGTFRADRHGGVVVATGMRPEVSAVARAPKGLPAEAKKWWTRHVPRAVETGVLDEADLSVAELAATVWDQILKCRRVLAQDGFFTEGSMGQIVEHPAMKMEKHLIGTYIRLCEQLGIGAVNRTRLGLGRLHGAALLADLHASLDVAAADEVVADGVVTSDSVEVGLPGAV